MTSAMNVAAPPAAPAGASRASLLRLRALLEPMVAANCCAVGGVRREVGNANDAGARSFRHSLSARNTLCKAFTNKVELALS